jgi:hypothetical protein
MEIVRTTCGPGPPERAAHLRRWMRVGGPLRQAPRRSAWAAQSGELSTDQQKIFISRSGRSEIVIPGRNQSFLRTLRELASVPERLVAGGESSATGSQPSAAGSESLATGGESLATGGGPLATSGESLADGGKPSAVGSERSATGTQPSTEGEFRGSIGSRFVGKRSHRRECPIGREAA